MEAYTNPTIFVPILLSLAGGVFFYIYTIINKKYPRKRAEGSKGRVRDAINQAIDEMKKGAVTYDPVYAQVFDNTAVVPMWYWETIPGNEVGRIILDHGSLGIQQDTDDGKKAYQLIKGIKDGVQFYSPVKYPILGADSPVELNYDTEHPEYEIILSKLLTVEKSFMQKYGQVLWWAAVIGFIIFMMVSG